VVLNVVTLQLIDDLFPAHGATCATVHRLARRRVSWMSGADTTEVASPGLCVSGEDVVTHLLGSLLAQYGRQVVLEDDRASGELMNRHDRDGASSDVDWVVIASGRPVSPSVGGVGTGRRTIIAAELALSPHADDSTSWMETTRRGWVFMAPTGDGTA